MKKITCILILLWCIVSNNYSQEKQRYVDSLFSALQTDNDLIYATAPQLNSPYMGESLTTKKNLTIHIFQPEGDTLKNRPMLVCFHGGGFVSGTKQNEDMMEFCRVFASKGYVTATAQYRLGMNLLSSKSAARAVYRAVQDSRALLRYLRENAEAFRISPDHIYLLGSSAGSFIALHNLFMDKESERPADTYQITGFSLDAGPDLGNYDAVGSYLAQSSEANGIIALWGALKDTTLIEAGDTNIPIFLIHGTADNIVPFGFGSPFGLTTLNPTYGSQLIDKRFTALSYPHETYFVQDEGHEFYGVLNGMWNPVPNQYWYIIVDKIRDFLFNIHKPTAAFDENISDLRITFQNKSISSIAWLWDFGDGNKSSEENPVHNYAKSGKYTVTLTAYSPVHSTTIISKEINISLTDIKNLSAPVQYTLYQNYPNPFNPITTIIYDLTKAEFVTLKVYNEMGQEVATLVNGFMSAATYKINFDASGLASGVYIYKLTSGDLTLSKKMVLLK